MDESLFIPEDAGVLKGTVRQICGRWAGKWQVKHGGTILTRSARVGLVSELTELEARRKVTFLADRDQQRCDAMPDKHASHFTRRTQREVGLTAAIARESVMSGEVGELAVCIELISNGFDVYKAVNRNSTFDIVASRGGEMFRVEVKRGTMYKTGRIDCEITNHGSFDVLAFVNHDGVIHYVPWFNLDKVKRSRIRDRQTVEKCFSDIDSFIKAGTNLERALKHCEISQ